MPLPLVAFDPLASAIRRQPAPHWARARAAGPLLAHAGLPVLSAFGYAEVDAALRDPERWSSEVQPTFGEALPQPMISQDGAAHARLRGLVNAAFTPRMVQRLQPRIAALADQLLAPGLAHGRLELVSELAHPLPTIVIAELIGVPPADRERFRRWSDLLVEHVGAGLLAPQPARDVLVRQRAALGEMCAYLAELAEERRTAPREDLLSALVATELDGSRLGTGELLAMLVLLLVAGNETTRTLIGNAVRTLLDHPAELGRVRADPRLLAPAVEEVLRFATPLPVTARRAARSFRFAGVDVAEGQILLLWLGSANRDETVFPAPDRFDGGRSPNRHLSFGFGPHYCLGANLARLEAQVALRALLGRTRAFRITAGEPLPLHPSYAINAVTALPLEVEKA
jgi:cytochrome P450